jgi:DNA-binding MarR family transcriptional regulator
VSAHLPLPALLSQVLVAFTIEFDNEFEHRMPHRTTNYGSAGSRNDPWLVSLVMWSNCMRFVREQGVSVGELERLARTATNFNGMQRWGYIVIAPDPADRRRKPPRSAWLIRATPKGRQAQEIWRPLFDTIEKRWQERFGKDEIDQLRELLEVIIGRIDADLPDCLPILGYGLFSRGPDRERRPPACRPGSPQPLSTLLSQVLLAFAIQFERESEMSLAICANVMRVLDEKAMRVRDLPILTGVSKEAISTALGFLQKRQMAVVEPYQSGSSGKVARLTPKGRKAQDAYRHRLGIVEAHWQSYFGVDTIRALRELLARLAGEPLLRGLEPYPDGWRASVRKPNTLPHYPMVLHRGGFPDGS